MKFGEKQYQKFLINKQITILYKTKINIMELVGIKKFKNTVDFKNSFLKIIMIILVNFKIY